MDIIKNLTCNPDAIGNDRKKQGLTIIKRTLS